jgi:hypothetical protein
MTTLKAIKQIVTISEGNTKTGALPSISLPPVFTCNPEADCTKGACYMLPLLKLRPSVFKAYNKNYKSFQIHPNLYFEAINEWINIKQPNFFRWHVSGDIPNLDYLERMLMISDAHPGTSFLCFTKQYHLVEKWLSEGVFCSDNQQFPENFSMVVSAWPKLEIPKSLGSLPKAWYLNPSNLDSRIPDNCLKCPGNCETCGMCFELHKTGRDVCFKHHGTGRNSF